MTEYEYGIMQRGVEGLHRGPMTKEAAKDWIKSWIEDCDPEKHGAILDMFEVVRRPVGKWEHFA